MNQLLTLHSIEEELNRDFSNSSGEDDPLWKPTSSVDHEESETVSEEVVEEEPEVGGFYGEPFEDKIVEYGGDTDDDELLNAREKVKGCNKRLLEIAEQLQREAAEGKLGSQRKEKAPDQPEITLDEGGWTSEYEDSEDEIHTPENSGEEGSGGKEKRARTMVVHERIDFNKFQWQVGQRFPSRKEFRAAVAKYAVHQGRNLTFKISNKERGQRLGILCKTGCPFQLYASWDSNRSTFVVKSVDPDHTCNRTMEANRQLKSTWLADQFLEVFKARPHWPANEIIETVRRAYRVIILKDKAYKIKYWAHKKLHGSMKDHYQKLGRYLQALTDSSPESMFLLVTDPRVTSIPPIFQRFFICFDGIKNGWLAGCRRVVCVDGCFLKTFLGGMLLAAVGRDGNDQMFPLAWAVVEGENNDAWEWFFLALSKYFGASTGADWTVISDQHQGIINAVNKVLPDSEHRHCARHIFAHWHKAHKGDEMKMMFWKVAKSYTIADYNDALVEMEKVSPTAAIDFRALKPQIFCRAFIKTQTKCDVIVNNLAETFNGYIIHARTKHIIYMLEDISAALMQRLLTKRREMERSSALLCPRIKLKLEKEKELAAACNVMPSTNIIFQVNHNLDSLTVNLEARTCTCRQWDLTGIPCCHAISCIFFLHMEAETFVDECYTRTSYLRVYNHSIPPCVGERHWPRIELPLAPPPIKLGPGRPRKNRRKDPHENPKKPGRLTRHGQKLSCSVCKCTSHTKRKCPYKNNEVQPQPKRPKGRPRKDAFASPSSSHAPSRVVQHCEATAEPSRTGRGGRVINSGRGSRGGMGLRGKKGSRGGRGSNVPHGFGVYFASDGSTMTNLPGQLEGPRILSQASSNQLSSQASVIGSSNQPAT